MTFVVGVHLGDAVGVLADTRVTVKRGPRIEYFDNALKVYQRPPLLIGLAGDAIASDLVVTKFQLEYLVPLETNEAYTRSVDLDWMISRLGKAYQDALGAGTVDRIDHFSVVIAAENSVALATDRPATSEFTGILNATIANSAQSVSVDDDEADERLVFVMDFPSGRVERALPATVVMRGSGRMSDTFLRTQHTALVARHLSFGDRLASIARDMVRAAEGVNHPSFNSAVLGWARSRGHAESVLQGLTSWPQHSAPPESYTWEAFSEQDRIPQLNPYAVGSDLHDMELGWVFDVKQQRKLRVQPIAKTIGPVPVRSGTSTLYIV
jgi:hypothetical protein